MPRRPNPTRAVREDGVETRRLEPAWGGNLIRKLQEEGIIPRCVQRLIIDCQHDNFVYLHLVTGVMDGDRFVDVLSAALGEATVVGTTEGADPNA